VVLDKNQTMNFLELLRSGSCNAEDTTINLAKLDGVPNEELSHRYAERAIAITGKDALNTLQSLWECQPLLLLGIIVSITTFTLPYIQDFTLL
jgi:hypothetical protein